MRIFLFLFATISCFSVEINWSINDHISDVGKHAEQPRVVMDLDGNSTVVFIQEGTLASVKKPFGEDWSAVEILSDTGASSPSLGVDDSGNVTVLWLQDNELHTRMRTQNGNWKTPKVLSQNAKTPEIAVSPSGDAIAIWVEDTAVQAMIKSIGGDWPQNPEILSSMGASMPHISVGLEGTLAAIWQNADSIYFSSTTTGNGLWSMEEVISTGTSTNPAIFVDQAGNVVAGWFSFEKKEGHYSNVIATVATKEKTGTWSSPISLSEPGLYSPSDLKIGVTTNTLKTSLAVWRNSYSGDAFFLESSQKKYNETTWSASDRVDIGIFLLDFDFKILSNRVNAITFMYSRDKNINITAGAINVDAFEESSWILTDSLSQFPENSQPKIAGILSGINLYTTIVWVGYDGSNCSIMGALGTTALLIPPLNPTISQKVVDYHAFKDIENTITWSASPSPNIANYAIYRNGMFLTTVESTVFTYSDRNRIAGKTDTYFITAIDKDGVESGQAIVSTLVESGPEPAMEEMSAQETKADRKKRNRDRKKGRRRR